MSDTVERTPAATDDDMRASADDPIFIEEQRHLSEIYAKLVQIRDEISDELEARHAGATKDIREMSEEIRPDFGGADEALETLAAIETLNVVIDAYNQYHDFNTDKLRRALLLLRQPYFAKVSLKMRPGQPERDVYIGAAGMTDERARPLIVDWRNPIAETYYNQENGPTSYTVNGRVRTVELTCRRQFDILEDKLNTYFDTTVAIEDSLLLSALKRHHSEKLQAITATIQREQNEVVRHEDVPVMLVNGIAGSGKTSVMLQRIAFLLYRERENLSPDQVHLFGPNKVFESYIDTVLPSMGEANPQLYTWRDFADAQGAGGRDAGVDTDPARLRALEAGMGSLTLGVDDANPIKVGEETLLNSKQVAAAMNKFAKFGVGPRFTALVTDELHERLERRFSQLSHSDALQEEALGLDVEEQLQIFGEVLAPENEEETAAIARRYAEHRFGSAHGEIDRMKWLRLDRVGMRMLGTGTLTATEWLYLRLLISGHGDDRARFVMIDEVQDYTVSQLMVLARFFSRAHFLMLGDENQAIREGAATFAQIGEVFKETHGEVCECRLRTSYRSSPEITALFSALLGRDEGIRPASVRRAGVEPDIRSFATDEERLEAIRGIAEDAAGAEGLTAIVCADEREVRGVARALGERVEVIGKNRELPATGVVAITLRMAKGLEFDQVVVPDASPAVYPDSALSRRRLYTATSRAMHKVALFATGELTELLVR